MDAILAYRPSADEDFYAVLGCFPENSIEQISAEYKARARELHPDKNVGGEDPTVTDRFQKLQEAKEVLTDPEKRADYDRWRTSGLAVSYKNWKAMKSKTHAGMHWAPPAGGKKMLPETDGATLPNEPRSTEVTGDQKNKEAGPSEAERPAAWTRDERSRRFQNYEF